MPKDKPKILKVFMFVDAQYSWRLFPLVSVTDMAENIGKI